MMRFSARAAAAAMVSMLLAGSALAQTPAPMAKPGPAAKMAVTEKPRTEASLACSKQADAKGLHGQERRKFRSECKKTGAKAN